MQITVKGIYIINKIKMIDKSINPIQVKRELVYTLDYRMEAKVVITASCRIQWQNLAQNKNTRQYTTNKNK